MRIACLQFSPQVGEVEKNIARADAVLDRADPQDLDLLVLPEMAFSGYNFKSLGEISPHLEPTEAGISAAWSRQAALKHDCVVVTGYPEKIDQGDNWPADPEYYNSAVIMDGDGNVVGNYRKSHLYYTDDTWALEGQGFYSGHIRGLGKMALGICMDINPYKFEADWHAFEFSSHVVSSNARLVVLSMAWCTDAQRSLFFLKSGEPDMDTLLYWITRMKPILALDSSQETIIVFGNRCGIEGDTTYVGTSTVLGIKSGEILLYGILGRDEEELLIVDTDDPPFAKLKLQTQGQVAAEDSEEDIPAPTAQQPADLQESEEHNGGSSKPNSEHRQPPLTDCPELLFDRILVTTNESTGQQHDNQWLESSHHLAQYPTRGLPKVDGGSMGIPSSSSHASHPQLTQSCVAAPATHHAEADEMRPAMSEGDYNNKRLDEFFDSYSNSLISDLYSESDEECWPRTQGSQTYSDGPRRGAARCRQHHTGTQTDHKTQDTGRRHSPANRPQIRPTAERADRETASESSLVGRIAAVALENGVVPTSVAENFDEEDIYKYIRGKNLTSEHHIRYHTRLRKARRAKQGLPEDGDSEEEYKEQEEERQNERQPYEYQRPRIHDNYKSDRLPVVESDRKDLLMLAPASHSRVRTEQNAVPNYTFFRPSNVRNIPCNEQPAEPTPIADTPMSHMTMFSQTRTRRRHDRQPSPLAMGLVNSRNAGTLPLRGADGSLRSRDVSAGRYAGRDTGWSRNASGNGSGLAFAKLKVKENLIPLQHPSRRPKAAGKQVQPLMLVPREAPKEKG